MEDFKQSAVVLVDAVGGLADGFKQEVRKLGFKLIGVFACPFSAYERIFHVDQKTAVQGFDEVLAQKSKKDILKRLEKYAVKAAIAVTEGGVELADQLTQSLALWGNRIEHTEAKRDKSKMREVLRKAGFPCPDFARCHSVEQVAEFAAKHRFPLVIKTPKGAGTNQVFICDDRESLTKAFQDIHSSKDLFGSHTDYALIEEYIGGKEYAVDTFSDGENVHITDIWAYDKIDTKYFKNVYYNSYTLPLDDPSIKTFVDHAVRIVKAFGIQRGPAHLEMKNDPNRGLVLIEIGARPIGSNLAKCIQEFTNFDLCQLTVEAFVHGKSSFPNPLIYKKHIGVAHCPIFQSGQVQHILGIEAIQNLRSYLSHSLRIKIGSTVVPTTDLVTTPLTVYLAHEDRDQIQRDLKMVHELFQLQTHAQEGDERAIM